ncbi:MAG: 50S ribosomal protein L31e, partial [Candidatus Woesearchaeota archaeon]
MENSLERTYNVPLRKGFQKSPKYKRAKKSVKLLKEFLAKHMKCNENDIKLGRLINEKIWERGYKYPPHHIKVTAVKDEKGIVKAELFGFKYEEPVMPEPVES